MKVAVGLDNQGLSGLELQYEKELVGRPGTLVVAPGEEAVLVPPRMSKAAAVEQMERFFSFPSSRRAAGAPSRPAVQR